MERNTLSKHASVPDPILPHSPSNAHHQRFVFGGDGDVGMKPETSSESDSDSNVSGLGMERGKSSESDSGSDVSDMIVEDNSKLAQISRERARLNSNYSPPSSSSSSSRSSEQSESESKSSSEARGRESNENSPSSSSLEREAGRGGAHGAIKLARHPRFPFLEDSDLSRSSTPSTAKPRSQPVARPLDSNLYFGYDATYPPPRRKAAQKASYTSAFRFVDDDDDEAEEGQHSSEDSIPSQRRRRVRSDSEFELSAGSRASSEEDSFIDDEVTSEDEYPPKPRKRGYGNKGWDEGESDSDYQPGRGRKRRAGGGGKRKGRRGKISDGYELKLGYPGSASSSSESEFEPGGRQGRKKKRKRKLAPFEEMSDFLRMTSRKKGAVSYKESSNTSDSDETAAAAGAGLAGGGRGDEVEGCVPLEPVDDNRECIEKILKKRIGRVGDTGNKTTCYAQRSQDSAHQPRPPAPGSPSETQYLVKWLKWSHLHNTWETEETLKAMDIKGMKKFENFVKREVERELWMRAANAEDIEYVKCQEELQESILDKFTKVERITDARNCDDGSQEYLCKWWGLPYSECTWEDGSLIAEWHQDQIDAFIERNTSDCIPNKSARVLRHRPKFQVMKEQLYSLGGPGQLQLRDYQLDGVNWLTRSWCKENSAILADEMGLGKTIQTIAFLHCLYHQHALYGPFLLVVPLSTVPAWQREFEVWAPEINTIVYLGDINSREKIREYEWCHSNKKLKFNALLTTYEILLKDKEVLGSVAWAILAVDEAHRLKNDDSLLYRTLMAFRTNHRLLITGTPLQNSLKELWSLLHFIMEKRFPDWESFEVEHHAYGEGEPGSLSSLHLQLTPFLLRRIKKDVEKSLPAKVEQILRVDMSSGQKQFYRWILTKNYKALSKGVKGSITGFINIMMEMKKCCNHTWIVREPDERDRARDKDRLQTLLRGSGKLFLLDKLLVRLKETGHRVLIFSQMVRMLDILADYMELQHFHFQRLDGSIRGDQRKDAIDHFNAEGSEDFCFLLSTRAGGLGVNLATADTVIIFDSDWNPQNDLQAQARAHRIGQKNQVNIYRLVTKNSIEEDIIERAKKKMVLDHLVIQRMDTTGRIMAKSAEPSRSVPFDKEELNAILKFGTEELFKEGGEGGGQADRDLQEMDIDDILRRAETQSTSDESSVANDLLSQFKVASFALDEEELGEGDDGDRDHAPLVATPTAGDRPHPLLMSPNKLAEAPPPPQRRHRGGGAERTWEEIIPEGVRNKVEEDERTREQLSLYLPPRQRKVQNYNEDSLSKPPAPQAKKPRSSGSTRTSSRRRRDHAHTTPPPERHEPSGRETVVERSVRGFSDAEVRRFIKSYRKFGNPKTRLEAMAADAELQEKSLSELERLAETLHSGCAQAEKDHLARCRADPDFTPKDKDKGASLRLGGVVVSASVVLRREEELRALENCVPRDGAARKKYRLLSRPKPVNWGGVKWTAVDDAKLLVGVLEHGLGNWGSIKADTALGLGKKILPVVRSMKPQTSHLQTRAEYLLKMVQSEAKEASRKQASKTTRQQPTRKKRPPPASRETIAKYFRPEKTTSPSLIVHIPLELVKFERDPPTRGARGRGRKSKPSLRSKAPSSATSSAKKPRTARVGRGKMDGSSGRGEEKGRGRLERGKQEEEDEEEEEKRDAIELDGVTFSKCKTLMKPVRRSLERLSPSGGDELPQRDLLEYCKKALVEIGDHITASLSEFCEEERVEWRTNLWVFVSKFTSLTPQKLHKVYKKAKKDTDQQAAMMPVKKRYLDQSNSKPHHSHHHPSHHHRHSSSASSAPNHHGNQSSASHHHHHRTVNPSLTPERSKN